MGCTSSVNIRIEEDGDNKKILANGKEVGNKKKIKIDKIEEHSNEDNYESSLNDDKKENNQNKTKTDTNDFKKQNISENLFNNQSINFKYLRENKPINMIKSNQINGNKKDIDYQYKFIPIKHPIDISSEFSECNQINTNKENDNKNINIDNNNKNDNYEVMNSMEERINNFNVDNDGGNYDEDGVNQDSYGAGDNEDMCNLGVSMDISKAKNKNDKKEDENKEICVIFEIQSTGVKYNIKVNQNIKLFELIEIFKKTVNYSSFEKPEFVFNAVFLIDYDKPISDYKIINNSKINVYV